MSIHSPRASPLGDEPPVVICQGKGKHRPESFMRGIRAGLLAVLHGLGGDGSGAFFREFEPILEFLLLLGNDGRGHPMWFLGFSGWGHS
jgi:hypothetical protein